MAAGIASKGQKCYQYLAPVLVIGSWHSLISSRKTILARAGTTPLLEKNASRTQGQMIIFHLGPHQFRESLRELLGELWFSYCSSREMPFRYFTLTFQQILRVFRRPKFAPKKDFFVFHCEALRGSHANPSGNGIRERETTIKIKFAFFWGGVGRGAERKIVQNAIFRGKRHDHKILKVKIVLSRNFVVMAQAPMEFRIPRITF